MTMMQMILGGGGTLAIISAASAWQEDPPGATPGSVTIAKPSQSQLNDLFVSFVGVDGNSHLTPGAGFSEDYDAASHPMGQVAHLTAGASEPASYDFVSAGNDDLCGAIICLRGAAFDVCGVSSSLSGTPAAPSITLSEAGLVLACYVVENSGTFSTPTDFEPVISQYGNSINIAIFAKSFPAGATGTVSSTLSSNSGKGLLIGIKHLY